MHVVSHCSVGQKHGMHMYITAWYLISLIKTKHYKQKRPTDTKAPCSIKNDSRIHGALRRRENNYRSHVSDNTSWRKGRCLAGLNKVDSPLPAGLSVVLPLKLGQEPVLVQGEQAQADSQAGALN